ncbi:putative non-ribosomal peptide synthetase [Gordonia effusa NBRC 100432]|uniref:Phenyloxazoline synthase MbtB n=1 Tax=Gordonia effusa NBRC 100432 TaxID=1077974 RepID=H0QXR1_9ACTN|nr:non-ribosomal peptide synthetase [Gordonia effusa]GAB17612.1 putative non-ribosomal peptide synthetase [Gordonia effusa NBRC 100432]
MTKDELRAVVAQTLDLPIDDIDDDQDLLELGLDSLKLMALTSRWRASGARVHYSALVLEPTIEAWSGVFAKAGGLAKKRKAVVATPVESAPSQPEQQSDDFPLAGMQHAYWIGRGDEQTLGGVAAHLYAEFDGGGPDVDPIDPERLATAVRELVARHPMLRAAITDDGTQRILPAPTIPVLSTEDLRDKSSTVIAARLDQIRDAKSHQRMDVAAGQVIDITLTLLPDNRHRLQLDVDMLAADAQSYRRLLDDLAALYDGIELPPIGYTFREYLQAREGDSASTSEDIDADRQWWAQRYEQLPEPASLPFVPEAERADPSRSFRLARHFDAEAMSALESAARSRGVTIAVALATVFSEVIARWSSEQRFLLNVPLFNREALHPDVDLVVGDFTNSVLVDVDTSATTSLVETARQVQRELHTAASHSAYRGLDVLRDLGSLRGGPVTASVVFTSGLGLGEVFSPRVTERFGEPVWIISQGPQVDIDAQVVEMGGGLLTNWDIRRDALPDGVAEEMFAEFCRILDTLIAAPRTWDDAGPSELSEPARSVRDRVNSVVTQAFPSRTLHQGFFGNALSEPDRIAVVASDGEITYGDLATRALSVGQTLADAGVRAGDTVAIVLPKGADQVAAVLGVLAAGAQYVPIGVDQPAARAERVLERSGARVALVATAADELAGVTSIALADAAQGAALSVPAVVSPESPAYVLFTSGSTGEPKGVQVSHRAAANTIDAIGTEFGLTADDRTLALSALDFDLSVFDLFSPLSSGGAIVCIDEADRRDAQVWSDAIERSRVSVLNAAPGLIGMIVDTARPEQLRTLRTVITGGDRVPAASARALRKAVPGLRFAGLGGATEAAIHSTICEVRDDFPADATSVPYGVPLRGVACRVVNGSGHDCPDWVVGELWIGGASVADGYRGDAERTAARFVTHAGLRWYRTGDLARYRPDGSLDFQGRADHQVKVRGHRVELGEVEAALMSVDGVRDAVVVKNAGDGLTAVIVAETAATPNADDLFIQAGILLPHYMIPDQINILDTVPLTANGKFDRAAAARIAAARGGPAPDEYVAPRNAIEAAVAYVMAQVLQVDRLGVESDFFAQGGNSILATTLTARLRGLLSLSGFRAAEVFSARTARDISIRLVEAEGSDQRLSRVAEILLELADISIEEEVHQ